MMLTDLAAVCRTSGLRVVEIGGWETRGRPASTGGFDPRGCLVHHTGGAGDDRGYAEWLAKVGRSDLPAPLSQLALDRQGTVYVLAAGRANHAGACRAVGGWLPAGDANEMLLGIEAMHDGSEPWTPVQYAAYVNLCRALCDGYRWPRSHVLGHKETSVTGKVDPSFDMNLFRLAVGSGRPPTTTEDDMQLSDKIGKGADAPTVGQVLNRLDRFMPAELARDKAEQTRDARDARIVAALPAAVAKATLAALPDAAAGVLTLAQIRKAAETGSAAAVRAVFRGLANEPVKP